MHFKKKDGSIRYTYTDIDWRRGYISNSVDSGGDKTYNANELCHMVEFLIGSIFVKFGGTTPGVDQLVTAFADVGRHSKLQLSLMPSVDLTLRQIASWKYIITTDLISAFYQTSLAKSFLKYCGVVTPFKDIRVYTRSAMGMPGSETVLEELRFWETDPRRHYHKAS